MNECSSRPPREECESMRKRRRPLLLLASTSAAAAAAADSKTQTHSQGDNLSDNYKVAAAVLLPERHTHTN